MSQLTYEHVTMQFQDVTALENVSFTLESGHIYGLLGRNGAGKSTLLSLSAGWRRQTSGRVLLDGAPVWENAAALSQIVCTSDGNMFPSMTVEKGLRWYARYRPDFSMDEALDMAGRFELPLRSKIQSLSTGYGTIFKMIVALASNAPFTFLDEPILGLDANHRDLFYRLVVEHFAHNPRCIVISTHLIEECAALLDHVVVLHRGRLLLDEDTERTLSRGYSVTGPAAAVAAYAAGRSVYGEQNLGGMTTAYLEGRPEGPAPSNLEFGRLDLQQLFIQLTNDSERRGNIK